MSANAIPRRSLKIEKANFFLELHHASSVPRDKEIAYETIEHLFRINYFANSEDLTRILGLPFFSENISDPAIFIERLNMEKSPKVGIDFKRYREQEYQSILKDQVKQEMVEDDLKEIREAALKRKAEYESLPSVLDDTEFPAPELAEPVQDDLRYTAWWKRLNLRGDPFPMEDGLGKIATELYEKIVFKTDLFQKYVYYTREEPSELFKETIFFGQFGSGKTTLFDYMKKFLISEKIYPLYVQLYAQQDFQSILIRFHRSLWDAVRRLYENLSGGKHLEPESNDFQENIVIGLTRIRTEFFAQGFIVFIDNLHKHQQFFQSAMDFLNYLQIFKEQLNQALPNIRIAFYIAGSLEWESTIVSEPRYSGSYSRKETITPVTEQAAFEMLNKRLEAFSNNPDNRIVGGGITLDFVRKIYRALENNKDQLTFRSFIRSVLTEFEKGSFDILQANPVFISNELKQRIIEFLDSWDDLRPRFAVLLDSNIPLDQRRKCLEVLVTCYVQRGISEKDNYFLQNGYSFKQLLRARLIDKIRLREDSSTEEGIQQGWGWTIYKPLNEANKQILKNYNLSLEDYLLPIYAPLAPKRQTPKHFHQDIAEIDELLKRLSGDLALLLKDARETHHKVVEIREQFDTSVTPDEVVALCVSSLCHVTNAILAYNQSPTRVKNQSDLRDFWSDYWFSPGETLEFLNLTEDNTVYEERVWFICNLYLDAFSKSFTHLKEEINDSSYLLIPIADLTNEEIDQFHEIRKLWHSRAYGQAVEKVSKLNEVKIRLFLYNLYRLQYGDQLQTRILHVDKTTREYILANLQKDRNKNLSPSINEFDEVNRGNYKNFLVGINGQSEGKYNWKNVFQYIFAPWTETRLADFLSSFADFNLTVSHLKTEILKAGQQATIFAYIINSIEFIQKINHAYIKIFEDSIYVIDTQSSPRFSHYVSLVTNSDKEQLQPIRIRTEDASRVYSLLKTKTDSDLSIDLSDYASIQSYYNMNYEQFFVFLSRAIHQSPDEILRTHVKMEAEKKSGCELKLSIKDSTSS